MATQKSNPRGTHHATRRLRPEQGVAKRHRAGILLERHRPNPGCAMLQSTVILIVLSLFLGAGAWLVFLWAVRTGEFDDPEGPKHRMLMDDEDAPGDGTP